METPPLTLYQVQRIEDGVLPCQRDESALPIAGRRWSRRLVASSLINVIDKRNIQVHTCQRMRDGVPPCRRDESAASSVAAQ
uniref:Uncharacterized protein n=1 Tax=Nelumbo nucifera TaxID=4432 RepID=A0A822ZTV6_NELNU|nr:TPA_asm: hypothetical protein HUJ06_016722 [Nelumbo nucifera]